MEEKTKGVDGFFDKLTGATEVLSEKLIDVAPEVTQALLNAVQFKGIYSLCWGVVLLILLFPIKSLFKKMWGIARDTDEKFFIVLGGVIFGFFYLMAAFHALNFSNLLAAFYPEGALALKALEAVGVHL